MQCSPSFLPAGTASGETDHLRDLRCSPEYLR